MSDAELADHVWWAWLWTTIEHGGFVALIVALAVEFTALKLGEPHKAAIEHARETEIANTKLEIARLTTRRSQLLTPEATASYRGKNQTLCRDKV